MSRDKLLDIAKQRLDIAKPEEMIFSSVFDELCIRYLLGETATQLDRNLKVAPAMQYERRDTNSRKNRPYINLAVQQRNSPNRPRTGGQTLKFCNQSHSIRILCLAGPGCFDHSAGAPKLHALRNSFVPVIRQHRGQSKPTKEE